MYTTLNPTLKFDALLFKEWMFKTQYRYFDYNNQDQTITNTYFLDSSLIAPEKKDSD